MYFYLFLFSYELYTIGFYFILFAFLIYNILD